jgi:hypothetical protein
MDDSFAEFGKARDDGPDGNGEWPGVEVVSKAGMLCRRAHRGTHVLILLNVQGVGYHFLRRAAFWPAPLQGDPGDAGSDKPGCQGHLRDVSQRVAHDLLAVTTVGE